MADIKKEGDDAATRSSASSSSATHFAAGGAGLAVMGVTLGLTAPFVFLKTPLPYMATPARKIKRALSFLPNTRAIGGIFVDLGSGDGEAVFQAYQSGKFSKVVGYELNWTLWCISQFRRVFVWGRSTPDVCHVTHIYRRDLFATSLPNETSAVMMFGVTPLMRPLSIKLARETKPGVHVLSYRFPIPLAQQQCKETIPSEELLHAELVYEHEEMRVYKVTAANGSQRSDTTRW